jgi:hypothetical protein
VLRRAELLPLLGITYNLSVKFGELDILNSWSNSISLTISLLMTFLANKYLSLAEVLIEMEARE